MLKATPVLGGTCGARVRVGGWWRVGGVMHVYVYRGSAAERVVPVLRHGWELCGCVAEGRCAAD